MYQKGFATLEVILMVMVIGILASIAVPRFTSVTTAANTAKIQSDLATIDTAVSIYIMENGTDSVPTSPSGLSNYLQDADNIKPPTGKAYIDGTPKDISDTDYEIGEVNGEYRATLDDNTAGHFTSKESGTTGGGSTGSGG